MTKKLPFANYVHNKDMHQKTTFRIKPNGSTAYLFKGQEISPNEFKELFPIGLINKSRFTERADPRHRLFL